MDPSKVKSVTLYNGYKMPVIGLGCYSIQDPQLIRKAGSELGYRLFDSASTYKNEEVVGEALNLILNEDKSATREEVFVISKVHWNEVEDVEAACRRSMKSLGVDYLDLYLVHWPIAMRDTEVTKEDGTTEILYEKINLPIHKIWPQMEALVDKGLVRSIGVSNFNVQSLWDLLSYARIPPAVNEVELNPINVQPKLVKYMKQQNIVPIAYCPIARAADTLKAPNVTLYPEVVKVSEKYGKTGA
jgi:diketogulonate reductase-like aldo/keto reductase